MSDQEKAEKEIMEDDGIPRLYDVNSLITFRVFGHFNGTVFQSKTLWMETGMTAILYWSVFAVLASLRWKGFSEFIGKESTIRAFIAMFSTLIGLLLSFYTALNLGRWWQMRMAVQHIVEGSKKLTMMVSCCTQDPVMLQPINRYARASLFLIFAASQMEEGKDVPRVQAVKAGLLTQEEGDKLEKANAHMTFVQAETLWTWLASAVTKLHKQGLSQGAPHYCALMGAVEEGRGGCASIQAFLETPIPLGYVHLLCAMVKLHNAILTVLMAMTSVMLAGGAQGFQPVGVFRTAFRAFFMPFLYNAILILNSEVTDPFGGDPGDFDWSNYDVNLRMSGESYVKASGDLPESISQFKAEPPAKV
jgi:predicted membrane chloride channel (bestrophin family)